MVYAIGQRSSTGVHGAP